MIAKLKAVCAWPVLVLLCLAPEAHAARVVSVHVRRAGRQILIRMHITVDAPPRAVFQALQDYAALPRYEPVIRALQVVPTAQPNRVRLYATIHACVLFFCKTMRQEQIMTATARADGGVVRSRLVPRGSDFRRGHGRWTVEPCPRGGAPACLSVRLAMVPSFWVPPLIGPWIIRRKVYEEARRASVGLERIARKRPAHHAALRGARRFRAVRY